MLNTISVEREPFPSVLSYVVIYAVAALALASVYYLPGIMGALLGVSFWVVGLVPLFGLLRERWLELKSERPKR